MIDFNNEKPRIIFVTGISGIGKSAFTKIVLEGENHVRVKINDFIKNMEQGAYLQALAKFTNNFFSNDEELEHYTFFYYLNNILDSHLRQRNWRIISDAASGIIPVGKLLKTATDMIFKKNEFDHNSFFNSGNNDILQTLKSYINYVIKNKNNVIVIENYHAIDSSSYNLLKEIIEESTNSIFILEYTFDLNQSISKFEDTQTSDFNNSELYAIHLKKMNVNDYLKIFSNSKIAEDLCHSFVEFDGNIRKLIDGNILLNTKGGEPLPFNSKFNKFNYTKEHLNSLEKKLKIVLAAIATHRYPVRIGSLKFFFSSEHFKYLWIDLEECLEKLSNHELICLVNDVVEIKHDFISKEIFVNEIFDVHIIPSYHLWIEYYKNLLNKNDFTYFPKNQIYNFIFSFYLGSKDITSLFKLLPEIKRIALEATHPEGVIEYIDILKKNDFLAKSDDIKDCINYSLVDIYYSLGLFDKAWGIFNEISNICTNRYVAYKAALLDRLDKHCEAIAFIKDQLNKTSGDRITLVLKLILMVSYRSSNNWTKCEETYYELYDKSVFKQYDEYGILLRNSEIILSLDDGIKNAKESITFFKNRNQNTNIGQSNLTLSLLYTWKEDYQNALTELNEAEAILCTETFERHIFFNNRAAIFMHQNRFDETVEVLLKEARKTIMCSFDKLTILINHLILYTNWNGKTKLAYSEIGNDIINSINKELDDQPDKVMHRLAYYTISQFYKKYNGTNLFHEYMKKAHDIHLGISFHEDEYWSERFNIYNTANNTTETIMVFDIGMISYWHFKIAQDL